MTTLPLLAYATSPVHIAVSLFNNSETSNINTHHQTVAHHADVQQQVPVVTHYSPPAPPSPAVLTAQPSFFESWKEYAITHPRIAAGGIIGGFYVLVFSSLYGLRYLCINHCPWARWHENISVKQLQKIPAQEKVTALIACISRVYHGNNTDIPLPLFSFIKDLRTELSWHNSFLSLYSCLQTTRLSFMFPLPESHAKKIVEQKERLLDLCKTLNSLCSLQHVKQHDTESVS